jgi:hypothetical protein
MAERSSGAGDWRGFGLLEPGSCGFPVADLAREETFSLRSVAPAAATVVEGDPPVT